MTPDEIHTALRPQLGEFLGDYIIIGSMADDPEKILILERGEDKIIREAAVIVCLELLNEESATRSVR